MTKSDREIIYLYAGDDHPKVKLTREREFSNIRDLTRYFHGIQDTFYVEFEASETITENLKLRCVSYGANEFDGTTPFFILEYDEILDSFYVWKSEGRWELNKLIATLYMDHSMKGSFKTAGLVRSHPNFSKHPRRVLIDLVIDKLNVDWSAIDIGQFLQQLDNVLELDKDENLDEFSFKSLISMAILKTKVKENKISLERAIREYHQSMIRKYHSNQSSRQADISSRGPAESIDKPMPTETTASLAISQSPTPIDAYCKSSIISDDNDNDNDQVVTNFNRHFKLMAEDYETFDLKSWAAYPRRSSNKKSRSPQEKNRISKVRS